MLTRTVLRIFDFALALLGLIAMALPILVCGLLVRLGSPGPAVFRQTRVGLHERTFICLKLRTMAVGTPTVGTHEVSAAMVTGTGSVLRRLKLDELPQLWNVLMGEMSLVGPRPCLPVQTRLIEERRQRGVFAVRPGVTGPAQVRGIDMSEPVRLAEIDQQWARRPRIGGYLKYIAMTAFGRGQGDRVNE